MKFKNESLPVKWAQFDPIDLHFIKSHEMNDFEREFTLHF